MSDAIVFDIGIDEFYPVKLYINRGETDVLDEGHPYLKIV